jgi:hypothetical protein
VPGWLNIRQVRRLRPALPRGPRDLTESYHLKKEREPVYEILRERLARSKILVRRIATLLLEDSRAETERTQGNAQVPMAYTENRNE